MLDLGTGTGCLLFAFLHERPNAFGIGVDRSEEAVRLARRNARISVWPRGPLLYAAIGPARRGRFDLVVSNPPYVATTDMAG